MSADDQAFVAVASALIDAPCAWLSEPAIAASVGWPVELLGPIVADLVAAGLIDRWRTGPTGPVVTLSPLGAAQLGVRLVPGPGAEVYRWTADAVSVRSRSISRAARQRTQDHDELVQSIPDYRSTVPDDRPARPRLTIDTAPRPRVILWGHCAWPWDEAGRRRRPSVRCRVCTKRKKRHMAAPCPPCGFGVRSRPTLDRCPACGDRPLSPVEYCLRCDRWGLDGYFQRRFGAKTHRPKPRRKAG